MPTSGQVLEQILVQVEQLPPEDRVRLIQRVAETLIHTGTRSSARRMVFGQFKGSRMSTAEDFRIAEWRPTEHDLSGE